MCLLELGVEAWYIRRRLVCSDSGGPLGTGHEEQHLFQDRQTKGANGDLADPLDWFPSTPARVRLGLLDGLVRSELGVFVKGQFCTTHRRYPSQENPSYARTPNILLFWAGGLFDLPGLDNVFAKHIGNVLHQSDFLLEIFWVYAGAIWENLVANLEAEC